MLKTCLMEQYFWEEAISTACYLQNRFSHSALGNAIPFTLWYCYPPNVSHLKVFGAVAYVYVHEHHRSKLDDRCFKGRFIGYGDSNGIKAYKIYNSQTGKVVYSRSVKFDEDWLFDEDKSSSGTLHMDGGASIQDYNLMLLKEIQQLRMLKESKRVQDHMGRDSYLGSKQHMLGQTHHLAHDRYLLQQKHQHKSGQRKGKLGLYAKSMMLQI